MLRRIIRIVGIALGVPVLLIAVLVILAIASPHGRIVLPVQHKAQFEHPGLADFGFLRASENKLVDAQGSPVRLRGLMPPDPAKLDSRGMFDRDFYAQVAATGANAIRIAVHPERWVHDPDYLWRHLDPIVGWVLENPIPDENVVYAAHIYPAHSRGQWDHWFGEVSQVYPVLATEWGFMDENRAEGPWYLAGSRTGYGEPFLEYLDAHQIGWIACWYDDGWKPPMFSKGWKAPTEYGDFVLEELKTGP